MNRRIFLQSVVGLIFLKPAHVSKPSIQKLDYGDGWLIEVGFLRCSLSKYDSETTLMVDVFVTTYPIPGMVSVTRMAPTETLRQRLQQVGIPVAWENQFDPGCPSLWAEYSFCPSPHDIAARLERALAECDATLLYRDPMARQ